MSSDETNQLLREIRDLQKAHFDYYVEFTRKIERSQAEAEKSALERAKEDAAYAAEQRAFQQELREDARRNHRTASISSIILIVALGGVLAMYFLGSIVRVFLPIP